MSYTYSCFLIGNFKRYRITFLKFISFWLCWVCVLHLGFLQLRRAGATLRCSTRASHCGGFSCCRAGALGAWASVVVEHGLSSCGLWASERRLSSCGTQAQLFCGMWDLPRPGLEPVFPALAGGFLTTVPPGKPQNYSLHRFLFTQDLSILIPLQVQQSHFSKGTTINSLCEINSVPKAL